MMAGKPTPRVPHDIPSNWAVRLVCTALVLMLAITAFHLWRVKHIQDGSNAGANAVTAEQLKQG